MGTVYEFEDAQLIAIGQSVVAETRDEEYQLYLDDVKPEDRMTHTEWKEACTELATFLREYDALPSADNQNAQEFERERRLYRSIRRLEILLGQ